MFRLVLGISPHVDFVERVGEVLRLWGHVARGPSWGVRPGLVAPAAAALPQATLTGAGVRTGSDCVPSSLQASGGGTAHGACFPGSLQPGRRQLRLAGPRPQGAGL